MARLTPAMFDLLCALGVADLSAADRAHVGTLVARAGLGDTPDGVDVVAEAASAGMMPLAYRHLVAGRVPVSASVARELTAEFRRHVVKSFVMTRRLRDLLDRLEQDGIDARAYKGPALAVDLYGHFAARQFGDLDILVRPRDRSAAIECFRREGLTPLRYDAPSWEPFAHEHRRHEFSLMDPETTTLVEVHWALTDRFDAIDVDVDWLMADPAMVDLAGRPSPVMSSERLLLALAIHGTRHVWARLAWLVDLAAILRARPHLDWDVVLDEARRIHFVEALSASIHLTHDLLGAPRPSWLRDRPAMARCATFVRERLARGRVAEVGLFDRARWEWHTADSAARRAAFVWRVATIPSVKDVPARARSTSRWRHAWRRGVRLVRTVAAERSAARNRR